MELNFVYVTLYGIYILVTKVGMILMCRFLVMIYVRFMLVYFFEVKAGALLCHIR
jgi:hypothetical protein